MNIVTRKILERYGWDVSVPGLLRYGDKVIVTDPNHVNSIIHQALQREVENPGITLIQIIKFLVAIFSIAVIIVGIIVAFYHPEYLKEL